MDSYNRGYGSGINELEQIGPNARIGNYSILQNVNRAGWFTAGFYAIAYRNGTDTVISYRGTDVKVPFLDSATAGGNDPVNGYGIAVGSTESPQGVLAASFYRAVTQNADNVAASNTVLTGHSLGGGLAGYVGAVSGTQAITFDHMPFGLAAINRAEELNIPEATIQAQIGNVRGYYTEGEFLQGARNGNLQAIVGGVVGGVVGGLTGLFSPVVGATLAAFIGGYGGSLGGATAALEANIENTPLDSNYTSNNPFDTFTFYHSATLLTALLWNKAYGDELWVPAAQELWSSFFDSTVADAVTGVAGRTTGDGTALSTLQAAIAYSALPIGVGELPFGDTGIWSLFNDADELGTVLAGNEASFFGTQIGGLIFGRKDIKQYLADLTVQYAGALALYDVEQDDGGTINTAAGAVDARQGVLRRTDDVLALDVSSYLWSDVLKSNADAVTTLAADRLDPLNLATFRTAFFDQNDKALLAFFSGVLGIAATPEALAAAGWGASSADIFDRFHIAATDGASNITLSNRSYTAPLARGESAHVDVYVGSSANETITGTTNSHNLIFGGGGNDRITTGDGDDVVGGGDGNDAITSGKGEDQVFGGFGNDRLDGGGGVDRIEGALGDDLLIANFDGVGDNYAGDLGTDTIVYKYEAGNSRIVIGDAPGFLATLFSGRTTQSDFGLSITRARDANGNDTGFGTDTLSSIERAAVEAGSGTDVLSISAASVFDYISYVDLGTQAAGEFDTINLRAMTANVLVDLSRDLVRYETPGILGGLFGNNEHSLTVRGAEGVLGGSGNDVLVAGIVGGAIPAYGGNPVPNTGAAGRAALTDVTVLLYGGAGSGITSSLLSGFNAATLSGQGDFNLVFRDRNLLTVLPARHQRADNDNEIMHVAERHSFVMTL